MPKNEGCAEERRFVCCKTRDHAPRKTTRRSAPPKCQNVHKWEHQVQDHIGVLHRFHGPKDSRAQGATKVGLCLGGSVQEDASREALDDLRNTLSGHTRNNGHLESTLLEKLPEVLNPLWGGNGVLLC